jgi:amino acid transporter
MVRWSEIDSNAPFAIAFDRVDMRWAGKVVAAGALAGIVTSLLVTLFGQVRLWMTLGRERLVPVSIVRRRYAVACPGGAPPASCAAKSCSCMLLHGGLRGCVIAPCVLLSSQSQRGGWSAVGCVQAHVHERTATPLLATVITAVTAGLFALLVDLEALADLVSIGALTVFFLVALACLWRRYVPHGHAPGCRFAAEVALMLVASAGLSVSYTASGPHWLTLTFSGVTASTLVASLECCTHFICTVFAMVLSICAKPACQIVCSTCRRLDTVRGGDVL